MAWSYTNRRGKTFYLHPKTTKTGKVSYACKLEAGDSALAALPEGYEVSETPNGQVSVRRVQPKAIADAELETVRQAAAGLAKSAMVERKGRALIVHYAHIEDRASLLSGSLDSGGDKLREFIHQHANYMPMLRFELDDATTRSFSAFRWCFLGGIDDWVYLDHGELGGLAAKLIPHLGKESFYELM